MKTPRIVIREIKAHQTPLAWVHLQWMEEYRLDRLAELYQQRKLEDYLDEQVERAEDQIGLLMESGRTRWMAEESVIGNLLAPPREYSSKWSRDIFKLIPEIERSVKI